MHGIMLVGPAGSGKSMVLRVLAQAIAQVERRVVNITVIDPKAISKEQLYGTIDELTREWSDGILTATLRGVIQANGESEEARRSLNLIVMDGDVDSVWIENLNSVLDDNKLLTLPTGERLSLPENCKLLFEVLDLVHTTPATVSRCGMVWFPEALVPASDRVEAFFRCLERVPLSNRRTWRNAQPGVLSFRPQAVLTSVIESQPPPTRPTRETSELDV